MVPVPQEQVFPVLVSLLPVPPQQVLLRLVVQPRESVARARMEQRLHRAGVSFGLWGPVGFVRR